MKFHIYVFRHGETYYNRSRRFTGSVNSRLTPRGIKQANVVAEKLRKKTFQIAFETSLSRSSDRLKIVLRCHPECKKVIVDNRMIERS
ncbi:histidine phosphatase family protein, partial [Candidatus Bathyarchaeota archaeon]|nr:histidine phosphatase family protein [Candidatus Bathyarchaeota archaeon]